MNTTTNSTITTVQAPKQALLLIFEIVWTTDSSAWAKFLATIISTAPTFRVITNTITFLAIISQEGMRRSKEFLLMAMLSLFDAIDGIWFVCAFAIDYGMQTRLSCFLTIRHLCFLLGGQSSTLMLTMISIDRLLSSHFRPCIIVIWTLFLSGFISYNPLTKGSDMVPYCFTTGTFLWGYDLDLWFRQIFLITSLVIYAMIIILYKRYLIKRLREVAPNREQRTAFNLYVKTRLRKVTVTLGISAMITLVMYVIPYTMWNQVRKAFPALQQYSWLLFVPVNLSSVANLFLFSFRHKEVRKAVQALFICKKLPGNLDNWFPKSQSSRHKITTKSSKKTDK